MNMRKEKGITLIALIITIIVMLILVGVTINVAINGGLLGKTEKVTFQTQVRQIQEGLQIRKAILLADNVGNSDNINSITLDELDIDQKLKTKFAQKLVILKESGDFVLYYNNDNNKVSDQEKIWLEELGIHAKVAVAFMDDVRSIANDNIIDDSNGNSYKYHEIYDTIKTKYPTVPIFYMLPDGQLVQEAMSAMYCESNRFIYNIQTTINMLNANYSNPGTTAITTEIEKTTRESLKSAENYKYEIDQFFKNSTTVADLITKMETYVEKYAEAIKDETKYVAINGDEKVLIDKNGVSTYTPKDEFIIMSENEATDFVYTATTNGDELTNSGLVTITKYTGDRGIIQVPRIIIKNDGEALFVTSIEENAFSALEPETGDFLPVKAEMPTAMLDPQLVANGTSYNEISTSDLATMMGITGYDEEQYENTRAGKNKLLIDYLLPTMLPSGSDVEDYIDLEGTGNEQQVYAYVKYNGGNLTFYNKNEIEEYIECIYKLIISEGIMDINGDNILAGNLIADLYLPKSLDHVSDNALANTQDILKIRTRKTSSEMKEMNDGFYYVFGSDYDRSDCEYITD